MPQGENTLSSGVMEYRCTRCSAPLEVTPETIIAVCSFCGTPNVVAGEIPPEELKDIVIVPSLDENTIMQKAVERTRKDPDLSGLVNKIDFQRPMGVYVPFYFVNVKIRVDYRVKARVRYRVTEIVHGQRVAAAKSKVVEFEDSIVIDRRVPVLARRNVSGYSIRALVQHYLEKPAPGKPLWEFEWKRSEAVKVLSAEFLRYKALGIVLDMVFEEAREKTLEDAKAKAREKAGVSDIAGIDLIEGSFTYRIIDKSVSGLTLIPYWMVPYTYSNGVYRYFMSGWDGEVIVAEEPVTAKHRLMYLLASIGGPGILGSAGLILGLYSDSQSVRGFGGALFLAGLGIAWFSAKGIMGSVRVESPYYTVDLEKEIEKLFEQARSGRAIGLLSAYRLAKEYSGR